MFNTSYPILGGETYANRAVKYPVEHKADDVIIKMLQAILMLLRSRNSNKIDVDVSLDEDDINKITQDIIAELNTNGLLTKQYFDQVVGTLSSLGNYTTTKDIVSALNGIYNGLSAAIGNIDVSKLTLLGEAANYNSIKVDSQDNATNVPTALKNIIDAINGIEIPETSTYDDSELRKTLITLATGTTPTTDTDYMWEKVAEAFKNGESNVGYNIKTLLEAIRSITTPGGSGVSVDLSGLYKALYVLVEGKEQAGESPTYSVDDFVGLFDTSTTKPSLDYLAGQTDTITQKITNIETNISNTTKIDTLLSTQPIYNYTVSIDDSKKIRIDINRRS